MALPIEQLPMIQRWDCHHCGACCRGSLIPLSPDDLARIKSQNWDQLPEFQGTPVIVRESWLASSYRLAQRADGTKRAAPFLRVNEHPRSKNPHRTSQGATPERQPCDLEFGICFLGFVWDLSFGVWDFSHVPSFFNN